MFIFKYDMNSHINKTSQLCKPHLYEPESASLRLLQSCIQLSSEAVLLQSSEAVLLQSSEAVLFTGLTKWVTSRVN